MSGALLKVAFGISMSLVRRVRPFRRLFRPQIPLSRAVIGCQVDRLAERYLGIGLLFGIGLVGLFGKANADAGLLPRMGPIGLIWETPLEESSAYNSEVERLLEAYEKAVGFELKRGGRGKVGLKVNTRSGRGLATPLPLLRGLIAAMEVRGFDRDDILLVDYSTHSLRQAGIMPFQTTADPRFAATRSPIADRKLRSAINCFKASFIQV